MNPFLVGWRRATRRAGGSEQDARPAQGTARLVATELGWLAGQAVRPSRAIPAMVVGVTIAALLAPVTPGPVVAGVWRSGIAVTLGVLTASLVHVALGRVTRHDPDPGHRTVAVGAAAVALVVTGALVVGYLLSAVLPSGTDRSGAAFQGMAVDQPVAVGAVLLLAGLLATRLGDRLRVPGALALLVLGMLIGDDGLGWIRLDDPQLVQSAAVVALVVILFEGGLSTRLQDVQRAVAPGVMLATLGVAVTAGTVALGGVVLLGLEPQTALLIAAIVSSTDAAAVFEVLRRAPIPRRLSATLQIESGTNDPVAVLLTVGLLTAASSGAGPATWVGFGVVQLVVGLALGLAVGLGSAWLIRAVSLESDALVPVLALAAAGIAYGTAAIAGGSGFLAVYVCGIALAARTPGRRRALRDFHVALSSSVEVGLFLLLGLLVFPADLPSVAVSGLVIVAVLAFVARPLAVAVTLGPLGFARRELVALSWLGMRGAVPIVLATVAFSAGSPDADWIFDVVFFVVLVSTLLQGTTAPWLVDRLGLRAEPRLPDVILDASPVAGLDAELVEARVTAGSPLVGRRLDEAGTPAGMLVTAIARDGRLVLPRGTTRLLAEDRLMITVDHREAEDDVRVWVSGPPLGRSRPLRRPPPERSSGPR